MLVKQGGERTEHIDRKLAASLAAIAGALNAAAFYAVGFFSANMTGNVSILSDNLALGAWLSGLQYLTIVVTFILGAMICTLVIGAGRRRNVPAIFAYSILMEAVLLAVLGVADLWLLGAWRAPALVMGLAFLMGLQNAAVTQLTDARVRTTHVSGMATDIGIELGVGLDLLRGKAISGDAASNRNKLLLHLQTISAFLVGGIVGVLLYRSIGGFLLIAAAFMLLAIALVSIARNRRPTVSL